jgi:hypothetical protein
MAQHVYTGNGAPPLTLQALPGSHYVDVATGKQYLFGSAWVEGGGGSGGGLVYATHDAAANSTLRPDPTVATAYLVKNVTTNAQFSLDLGTIDPLSSSVTDNSETVVEFDRHMIVSLVNNGAVLRLSLSGATYVGLSSSLEPTNAADRLRVRITQLGAGLQPADRVVLVDASAVSAVVAAAPIG